MTGPYLVCTDLDRTLIPNGPHPESPGARRYVAALAAREDVTLTFVTGRHRALIEEALVTYRLPVPDYVIGDVGTTMYRVGPEHAWDHVDEWESDIARDWDGRTATEIRSLMYDLTPLRLQERAKQNRLKLSFYLPLHAKIDELEVAVRARLEPTGIRARLVWSVDDVADIGLLDVLPERASKRHAIEALMQRLGVDAARTVFSGDSGNDLEVLVSPIPSVLVANARSDVQELALELASEEGTLDRLYVARGGFLGMNGNYGAGVLEGIVHYHPELAPWFEESAA